MFLSQKRTSAYTRRDAQTEGTTITEHFTLNVARMSSRDFV